ncbi:MAG: galactokinase [Spirochaetales bacterium]|nr:galactokinase [Spirochaetales bacterium]
MDKKIFELHKKEYNTEPEVIVSAPGVLSLLGEVLDCNDGYVLQAAINRRVFVAVSRRADNVLKVYSHNFAERKKSGLSTIKFKSEDKWLNYIRGVLSEFSLLGFEPQGINLTIVGDIPLRLSLGSSAALCVAVGVALRELHSYDLSDIQLIQSCYLAESRFMGVKSSITDCLTSYYARKGKLLFFDLRTVEYHNLKLNLGDQLGFYVTNSSLPLVFPEDEDDERDFQCSEGLDFLKQIRTGNSLRDYSDVDIKQSIGDMPEAVRRVSLHVVQENQRVLDAVEMVKESKIEVFGKILNRSHESLRDNFEVSCPEVDWLVKRSHEIEGILGSRLIGKGSGGCICSLIYKDYLESYKEKLKDYESIFGFKAKVFPIEIEGGVEVVLSAKNI